MRRKYLHRADELATAARQAEDHGHVNVAIDLALDGLSTVRELSWPRRANDRVPLIALSLHTTLQNAYREHPQHQWRASSHLRRAMTLATLSRNPQLALLKLEMDRLAVVWLAGDLREVARTIHGGTHFEDPDSPGRSQFLGRKAEYLHIRGNQRSALETLRRAEQGKRTEPNGFFSAHHLEAASILMELRRFDLAAAEIAKARFLLDDDPHDYFRMLTLYRESQFVAKTGDLLGASRLFREAESLRMANLVVSRETEHLSQLLKDR